MDDESSVDDELKWVRDWLSDDRLVPYLAATHGDMAAALALHQYNARLSAAFKTDLDHVEVAVRNGYHRAMSAHSPDWMFDGGALFPSIVGGSDRAAREQLEKAIRDAGGDNATPGKVVAELSMGFWKRFSEQGRETTLWAAHANMAFVRGTPRRVVHEHMTALVQLRNRIAHAERIVHWPLNNYRARIDDLAKRVDPRIAAWISRNSAVPAVNESWKRYQQQQVLRTKAVDQVAAERVRQKMVDRRVKRREEKQNDHAPKPVPRGIIDRTLDERGPAKPDHDNERER